MIVCSLGYGYLGRYVLKELSSHGVLSLGVSSKQNDCFTRKDNFIYFNRNDTDKAIKISTNILVTAPPDIKGCPIFQNYFNYIANSNIKSITYISTTGVYGNYNGAWVNEKSSLKAKYIRDKNRIKAEKQWMKFSRKHNISLNIMRVASIYGPERAKSFINSPEIIVKKKEHYFSRIHIFDIARIISMIILRGFRNEIWNLADNLPSSREEFLLELVKVKEIKKYRVEEYKSYKKHLSSQAKKFWFNNKKVSNNKVHKNLKVFFIFPNFYCGLKSLKHSI